MILVDSSVWIDHFRQGDAVLAGLLEAGSVLAHPFVIAELALGTLRQCDAILGALRGLPRAEVAAEAELMHFIERHDLAGLGIGFVDTHLLASAMLTPDCRLWTRDRRLAAAASRLGLGAGLA